MTCPYLELGQFSCDHMEQEDIRKLLQDVHAHGCKNVVATMGSRGQIFYNGKEYIEGRVHYVEPIDTMGAGDSFLAALMVSLLIHGWKKGEELSGTVIEKALDEAAAYSAKNCLHEGGFGFKNLMQKSEAL